MPESCFSYPSDVPAPSGPRRMVTTCCFSYQADVPHRMSTGTCFSYSPGVPPGTGNGDAALSAPPGLRTMTYSACFRY
jgi:hypothetical protein